MDYNDRNGIQQRKSPWQDGVLGTNCPIPPGRNWTYHFQAKDQIGTFSYFPSTAFHRAAGGFGGLNVNQRSVISKPYPEPDGEFTLLIGDWYKANHKVSLIYNPSKIFLKVYKLMKIILYTHKAQDNPRAETLGKVLKSRLSSKLELYKISYA